MIVRIVMVPKMLHMVLMFVILICCPFTFAEEVPEDNGVSRKNESKCGCTEMFVYDAVNDRCLVNFKKVMRRVIVPYPKPGVDVFTEDGMAKSLYMEGERIFQGIMVSVILFIVCASVCVVAACIYCFRINYTDRRLKHNVKALAKKMKRNYNSKKMSPKPASLPPISESCNVVVEPAGVYVA